jgi:putative phosphonate metabolism protein
VRAEGFDRYAVYFTPDGALARAGAAWLGWDVAQGSAVAHPDLGAVDLAGITATPCKYGMHGTLKPPFALAQGTDAEELRIAVHALAEGLTPVSLAGLEVAALGPFLALKPVGDQTGLARLAAEVVTQLDRFRASPSEAELARRRQSNLSAAQERHLRDWGYPYVMDQLRFHITLTGRLSRAQEAEIAPVARVYFAPYMTAPFVIGSLTLAGQGTDGMFYEIERIRL